MKSIIILIVLVCITFLLLALQSQKEKLDRYNERMKMDSEILQSPYVEQNPLDLENK